MGDTHQKLGLYRTSQHSHSWYFALGVVFPALSKLLLTGQFLHPVKGVKPYANTVWLSWGSFCNCLITHHYQ